MRRPFPLVLCAVLCSGGWCASSVPGNADTPPREDEMSCHAMATIAAVKFTFRNTGKRRVSLSLPAGMPLEVSSAGRTGVAYLCSPVTVNLEAGKSASFDVPYVTADGRAVAGQCRPTAGSEHAARFRIVAALAGHGGSVDPKAASAGLRAWPAGHVSWREAQRAAGTRGAALNAALRAAWLPSTPPAQVPAGFTAFRSDADGFSAAFPGRPNRSESAPSGRKVSTCQAAVGDAVYTVATTVFSSAAVQARIDTLPGAVLEDARRGLLAGTRSRELSSERVVLPDGSPALDITCRSNTVEYRVRLAVANGRVYQAIAAANGKLPPHADAFVKSFRPGAPAR